MKSRRRLPEKDEDPHQNIFKILHMNLVSIKNMKWALGNSYQLINFQVRESLSPLNIPIPTPASDRGGDPRASAMASGDPRAMGSLKHFHENL